MEERCGDRLLVEMQLSEDLGDAEGVVDELLAGASLLALVRDRRERERARDQVAHLRVQRLCVDRIFLGAGRKTREVAHGAAVAQTIAFEADA